MRRRSLIAPTAVIFDFDLTLADSRAGFVAGHRFAAERVGVPAPSEDAIARAIGTPLELVVPRMFEGMDDATAAEYIRLYRIEADRSMLGHTVMLPGAADAVGTLRDADIKVAIVSQKLSHLVHSVLKREGLTFDVVLGGEDVAAFKPDPRGLLLALDRLDAAADDAIYTGDTTIDAQAAANAGLRFVGVLTGPTSREDFAGFEALAILESVGDLPAFLGVAGFEKPGAADARES